MTERKHAILRREVLFQGYFRVDRLHIQRDRFDGGQADVFTREIFQRGGDIATVLLFDPQHDKVVLLEQYRPAPALSGQDPWMIEIVAGVVDSGETPEQAARREALEEAGCVILDLLPIASYFPSSGGTSEYIHLYVGRIEAPAEDGIFGLQEEGEDIRIHVIDAMQAINLLYTQKIRCSQALIALQWFAMRHTELRSRWLVSDVGTPII